MLEVNGNGNAIHIFRYEMIHIKYEKRKTL